LIPKLQIVSQDVISGTMIASIEAILA